MTLDIYQLKLGDTVVANGWNRAVVISVDTESDLVITDQGTFKMDSLTSEDESFADEV